MRRWNYSARFPALASQDYRRYLAGNFLSNIGSQIQSTAITYHVFQLTHNSSYMVGLLGLFRVAPLLTFTLFGGVLADQADRRKVMLATQTTMALVSLILAVTVWTGLVTPALIYTLVVVAFTAVAFDGPARQSLVVSLVPKDHFPNAVTISATMWRFSDVLGPVLAGALIGWRGAGFGACYILNAVSFLAVIYAVWRMPPKPPEDVTVERPKHLRDVLSQIKDGWRFVNRMPVIRHAMWIDFWATFFSTADALLPAMSKILKLGPLGYGFLCASAAIGAAIAASVLAFRPTVHKQGAWVVGMVGIYGAATCLFAISGNLVLASVFLAITGAADMVSTVMRQTLRQLATPDSMRGRMTAISSLFFISGPRLGDYEAGVASQAFGDRGSIAIGGSACILVSILWSRAKALIDYKHGESS